MLARRIIPLLLVVFIFQASLSYVHSQTTESQQIGRGDFTLPIVTRNGLTGKYLTLSNYLGKVILLEFMAPWCPPCQQTVSVMEKLYNEFAAKGVVFVAVAEPLGSDAAGHYRNVTMTEFFSNHTTSLTYVIDRLGWQVGSLWGVQSVPTLFIVSKAGSIVANYTGSGNICTCSADIINAQLAQPVPEFGDFWLVATLPLIIILLMLRRRNPQTSR